MNDPLNDLSSGASLLISASKAINGDIHVVPEGEDGAPLALVFATTDPESARLMRDAVHQLSNGSSGPIQVHRPTVGRDLTQVVAMFERGMDGYASRMTREGRDYFGGLLSQLRDLSTSPQT